uniref:Uncharacterized protein n=1 Tax=Burkholderia sp. (strain CCGE1003) TaxID=640512 RepID=E1T7F7_BURSG
MSSPITHQRLDAISNTHAGREFEARARRFYAERGIDLQTNHKVLIGTGAEKKNRAFDLGCSERRMIVECKSHRWTGGSNIPAAKITVWNEAMYYFSLAPGDYKKVMFVLRHECEKRRITLASYYLKNYGHMVPPDVEFWEYDETTHEALCVRPSVAP